MGYFPVPEDAFEGKITKPVSDYLVVLLNWLWSHIAKSTPENLHFYADGTNGDDDNDGRSPSAPKKTKAAVFALIPDHIPSGIYVFFHLSGVFTETGYIYMPKTSGPGNVVVCGGTNRTPVDANVYTATSAGVTHLTDSGAPFTADQYYNLEVEILTGPAAGQYRAVQGNSTTAVTPMKNFSVDPGVGATFRFVRPSTTLNASVYFAGPSSIHVQNLYWATGGPYVFAHQGTINLSHLIVEASNSGFYGTEYVAFGVNTRSPVDGSLISGGTAAYSILYRDATKKLDIFYARVALSGIGAPKIDVHFSLFANYGLWLGARAKGNVVTRGCVGRGWGFIANQSGYATTKINPASGVGLLIKSSDLDLDSGTIENCGSHGIEIQSSRIDIQGALAGTGNGGAGIRGHLGAKVLIKNGDPPTITGTVGDFSVDGSAGVDLGSGVSAFWNDVDGGTPHADATEMVVVKEQ